MDEDSRDWESDEMNRMDEVAGVTKKPKRVKTSNPPRLLFKQIEAAAILGVCDGTFRQLVRSGLVKVTSVPGSVEGQPMRMYSLESLKAAVREMTEAR